jgi:signal transduction histidine kinase
MPDAPSRHSLPVELERLLHDLRGALNGIRMHLELLKRAAAADEGIRLSVATIEQELTRLAAQLPAAFSVAAIERGELQPVDVRAVVESALHEHELGTVTVTDGPRPQVRADARLLALAIAQLARNAVEATRAAGATSRAPRVSIVTAGEGDVTVVVRDWGRGLASTNPRSVIRLTSSPDSQRVGVGLLIVERIARLHGGTLEFGNPPDGGAEVRLTIPRK